MPALLCHDMGMISPWLAVLAVLAAARITRLITRDTLTANLRMRTVNALGIESKAAELIQCAWCAGMWVSAATISAAWLWGHHWWVQLPILILACAHAVGLIATGESD